MSPPPAARIGLSSRVITEPLGGSPLSLAVQARRLPREIQPWWPATVGEWREHAVRVRSRARDSWHAALQPALAAQGAAATRLERTVAESGVVVTTGQQAALFGGPLYTLGKALTALELANALEEKLGIPVAPVFWAATDDADFLEAATTYVADANGLHELHLEATARPGTPMADVPLAGAEQLLERLREACGSAAYEAYFELARAAFMNEKTLGAAYVHLVRELLAPLGVAVLDSSHSAYRDAARPILLEALERASDVAAAVAQRAAALRKSGFEPQVDEDESRGLTLVSAIKKGVKRRLSIEDARRFTRPESHTALSPNVLLRPVVEREILPTVAYVGGPAELAYFTQANAVAAALGRQQLVAVPRWSCTVIEPFAERALNRLGAEYHELRDRAALERRLAWAGLPEKVAAAWEQLQEGLRTSTEALVEAVRDVGLAPPEVPDGLRRSLQHKLNRGQRRLLAAAKRRAEDVQRDLDVASAALFPKGKRQERVLNFVPMLARGGDDLLDAMRAAASTHARALLRAEQPEPVAAR